MKDKLFGESNYAPFQFKYSFHKTFHLIFIILIFLGKLSNKIFTKAKRKGKIEWKWFVVCGDISQEYFLSSRFLVSIKWGLNAHYFSFAKNIVDDKYKRLLFWWNEIKWEGVYFYFLNHIKQEITCWLVIIIRIVIDV